MRRNGDYTIIASAGQRVFFEILKKTREIFLLQQWTKVQSKNYDAQDKDGTLSDEKARKKVPVWLSILVH